LACRPAMCKFRTVSEKPETFQAQLGSRITRARAAAGLTQADLAAKLEIDRTAITKIEAGTRAVSAQEIVALGAALGRSLDCERLTQALAAAQHRVRSALRAVRVLRALRPSLRLDRGVHRGPLDAEPA